MSLGPQAPSTDGVRSPIVRCEEVTYFFGGVRALASVSVDLFKGEIVGLVGENGAGKSTLARILSGLLQPDQGRIWFGDRLVERLTPERSRAFGVETVYQNLLLCDNLSVAANVMLGQEPVRFGLGPLRFIDRRHSLAQAQRRLAEIGVTLSDYSVPVRRLSGGQRQAVAIARASVRGHLLMIFDEPTAALGLRQKQAALSFIERVAGQGVSVILISHNLDEVMAVAHRIVALRLGEVSLDKQRSATNRAEVETHMSGFHA